MAIALANWLGAVSTRLGALLRAPEQGLTDTERRDFATDLGLLRPMLQEAGSGPALARAIALLAILLARHTVVLRRLTDAAAR